MSIIYIGSKSELLIISPASRSFPSLGSTIVVLSGFGIEFPLPPCTQNFKWVTFDHCHLCFSKREYPWILQVLSELPLFRASCAFAPSQRGLCRNLGFRTWSLFRLSSEWCDNGFPTIHQSMFIVLHVVLFSQLNRIYHVVSVYSVVYVMLLRKLDCFSWSVLLHIPVSHVKAIDRDAPPPPPAPNLWVNTFSGPQHTWHPTPVAHTDLLGPVLLWFRSSGFQPPWNQSTSCLQIMSFTSIFRRFSLIKCEAYCLNLKSLSDRCP